MLPARSVCVALKTHSLLAAKATWPLLAVPVSTLHVPVLVAEVVNVCTVPSVALAVSVMLAPASAPLPCITGATLVLGEEGAVIKGALASVSTISAKAAEVLLEVTSLAVML